MDDEQPGRFVRGVVTMIRLVAALAVAAVVVPPMAGAVAVGTLMYGPVPAGELPDERPRIKAVPSIVLDADGNQIAQFRGFDRTVEVSPGQIPDVMVEAIVAIEDRRFWTHNGVDVEGISRAARVNLEVGEVAQGGSTITQQYVKNVYLSREQTLERKVEEALLAVELEKRMTKDEILFGYLTTSYFGEGAYGIGAAAEVYFAKPVQDLDISEAAMLAGLVKAPTRLSPRQDLAAAEERRRLVLEAMHTVGYIDDEDYEREVARHLWLPERDERPSSSVTVLAPRPLKGADAHPYFVDWIEADLLERLGPDLLYQGGLTIETSIDPERQAIAEFVVAERLEGTEYPIEMSLVSLDPSTGHVVAMVGGRDYAFSQVNLAIGGSTGFQPGSSFKPIVLATAFEQGMNPDVRYNAPGVWTVPNCTGKCTIANYDNAGRGRVTLASAMRASVNTVFAQLILDVGVDDTIEMGRRLGLERLDPDGPYGASLSLGAAESSTLEMASAYGVFANRGIRVAPTGVLRVIDDQGNVLIDNRRPAGARVLDQAVADNMTEVLTGVVDAGTGTRAQLDDRPVAGKTGTAQEYRAAWFVGYTPQIATAVWMGHADRLAPLRGVNGVARVTGGSHPALAWQAYMEAVHVGLEPLSFPEPADIVTSTAPRDVEDDSPADGEGSETTAPPRPIEDPTTIGEPDNRRRLAADCGGSSCTRVVAPAMPYLPPPESPPPPPTTAPPPTAPPTTAPPTTAPPVTNAPAPTLQPPSE